MPAPLAGQQRRQDEHAGIGRFLEEKRGERMGPPAEAAHHMPKAPHGLEGCIERGTAYGVIEAVETAPARQAQHVIGDGFSPVDKGRTQALYDGAAMRRSGRESFRSERACELNRDMADAAGTALNQDGFAAGQLQSIAINNSGLVVGTFSNGQNIDLAEVPLVHFNGTNFLQALSGNAYAATTQSGAAIAGASGTIDGSSLEGSNTDIADEFTKLIVTQQAYSANTKVITTANNMVQDLLNVLR